MAVLNKWWERDDLRYVDGYLFLGGQNLYSLAEEAQLPCYVYHPHRIKQNILRLRQALEQVSLPFRIFYAVKANRNPCILTYLKSLELTGIDCCSPNELKLARQVGFLDREISFTGTSVSDADLAILNQHPDIFLNCDSLSQIRRLGKIAPGKKIGIRINPHQGLSYRSAPKLQYSGQKITKFGIYKDSFLTALQLAADYQLQVTGIHCHVGWGFLNSQLPLLEVIFQELCWCLDQLDDAKYVNLGGGLGVPLVAEDSSLNLELWTKLIAQYFAPRNLEIFIEPGDYLVRDAGVLLLQITTIEQKMNQKFVYVNGGFNINLNPAVYQIPLEIVPVVLPRGNSEKNDDLVPLSVVGNINEAVDIFSENIYLPSLQEGDYLAFLNAGGYGSSMSSNHCMRGDFYEYLVYA